MLHLIGPLSAMISRLVGYWPMDESSGTSQTSDLAGANKGTLNGMVLGDHVTGINGKALNFDGSGRGFL